MLQGPNSLICWLHNTGIDALHHLSCLQYIHFIMEKQEFSPEDLNSSLTAPVRVPSDKQLIKHRMENSSDTK